MCVRVCVWGGLCKQRPEKTISLTTCEMNQSSLEFGALGGFSGQQLLGGEGTFQSEVTAITLRGVVNHLKMSTFADSLFFIEAHSSETLCGLQERKSKSQSFSDPPWISSLL